MIKFVFIFCLFISFGLMAQTDSTVEDKLYQCLVDEFKVQGINLDEELLTFENYLIENKILESKSGKSYLALFKWLTSNESHYYIDYDRFNNLTKISNDVLEKSEIDCLSEIDSITLKKSQLYKSRLAILEYGNNQKTTNFSSVFEAYSSVINEKSYQHKYYKSKVLFATFYVGEVEAGIPESLNNEINIVSVPTECLDCKTLFIKLNSSNHFFVDEIQKNDKEIEEIIKDFVLKNSPNYWMEFGVSVDASSDTAFNVVSFTKNIIEELKNQKSEEIYNKPYKELNNDLKKEIDKYYPRTIELHYSN